MVESTEMSRFIAIFSSHPAHFLSQAQALSPRVEMGFGGCVLLEVPSSWEERTFQRLHQQEATFSLKIGVASTRTTALLASLARPGSIVPKGRERSFLAPLPVQLLRGFGLVGKQERKIFLTLVRWGIRTLGQLALLPEADLTARLGTAGIRLQQMACGQDIVPARPYSPPPRFEESEELDWSLDSLEPLTFLLGRLLDRLCRRLRDHGKAAETLRVVLPLRDAKTLLSLTASGT